MILLICLLVAYYSISCLCAENDREDERLQDYEISERRHDEIISVVKENKPKAKKTKVRRRVLKDKEGNIIAEEIIEEE